MVSACASSRYHASPQCGLGSIKAIGLVQIKCVMIIVLIAHLCNVSGDGGPGEGKLRGVGHTHF